MLSSLFYRQLIKGAGARATSRKILIQFSLALCLLYLVFLAGIDQTRNRIGCIFVAVLLHYLTLACLMWMAVEAQNMYTNVVTVLDGQPRHFWIKASIVAWGEGKTLWLRCV